MQVFGGSFRVVMLHQNARFFTVFRNLESAGLYKSLVQKSEGNLFWSYFGKNMTYAKGLQWLKLWGMFVRRLKFKTCKMLDVYWIFVRFHIIFKGSVFWVTLYKLRQLNIVRKTFWYSNVQ